MAKMYSIPRVSGDGVASEADALARFNNPIASIEDALDELSGRLDSMGGKCSVLYEHAPLSAACFVGALVYYDTDSGRFAPATAALLPMPGEQGQSVEAPCSRVVGMVVRLDADTEPVHGSLLCGGYWEDAAAVEACLGDTALPGTYYLSGTVAGRAVTAERLGGRLQQGVLTYMGAGKIFFGLHYLAHDNHWHASRVVHGGWTSAAYPPEGVEAPSGYSQWYDEDADEEADEAGYARLGELQERTTAVFHDGLLQCPGQDFKLHGGYLWHTGTTPERGSVVIFNSFPFAYGSPVVRDIVPGNGAVSVSKRNGTVAISLNDFKTAGTNPAATAVSSISGRNITLTPVVTGILAGPGVSVSVSEVGVATISSSEVLNTLHDAYVIDHYGTNQANDGILPYIMFPAGRLSSLTMTLPVSWQMSGTSLSVRVWAMLLSAGAFNVVTAWVPQPATGAPVDMSSLSETSGTMSGGAANMLSYVEAGEASAISGRGTLVTKIAVQSSPQADIRVFRIGYRFVLA